MSEGGDKKHEATPYRREKAREEGNLAKSQDLTSALLLLAAVWTLDSLGPRLLTALVDLMSDQLRRSGSLEADTATQLGKLLSVTGRAGLAILPISLALWATAVVVNMGQTGFLWLPDKLNFDWKRVDPIAGFKRLFSISNSTRLGFGVLKIGILAIVLFGGVFWRWEEILHCGGLGLQQAAAFVWDVIRDLVLQAAGALVILAVIDFGFQKWKFEQDLRMTDEEIREEMKSTQGDPQIKARRRRVQRQLLTQRLQNDVPKADVVVTNPTELAIAIQYDPLTMKAPIVLAKGADLVAARIRRIALEAGVPIVERKPLAQALFKAVQIGQPIPVAEYAAVAEVLKYVYQVKGKTMPNLMQPPGR